MKINDIKRNKKMLKLLNKKLSNQINVVDLHIKVGFKDIFKVIFEKNNVK